MSKAARAIIFEDNMLLVMHRNKQGSQYFTLVGGRVNDEETIEDALVREVKEETGLDVTAARLVYVEEHHPPYNEQYIFYCEVGPHVAIELQTTSEEHLLNQIGINTHQPQWADIRLFPSLPFRTPQLQQAIVDALTNGFPTQPIKL